ncbi:hypothetical protein PsorP6_015330 [Peronosclerospora sorghi]|uniref:Uncharacterized protein n=1 Tax=Peronosclerospora sorghi TaxID=230839 RepID=A0ACC0VVF3_9STRA|nr:hypothetical protein PsorP6_015330 [Peronosclerospora sorghi]
MSKHRSTHHCPDGPSKVLPNTARIRGDKEGSSHRMFRASNGKISFQECSWMEATRASPQSLQESVIRVCYRLSSEKVNKCSYIDGKHIDQVCNQALGAIGAKMKANTSHASTKTVD